MLEAKSIHENSLEAAQFLVENIELLPKEKALGVAMGSGRNAIYLATTGFDVEGIDISPEAVPVFLQGSISFWATMVF